MSNLSTQFNLLLQSGDDLLLQSGDLLLLQEQEIVPFTYPSITPNESTIKFISNIRVYRSPIGATQSLDRGGEHLIMNLVYRNLTAAQRAEFIAFVVKLNGHEHRTLLRNHAEDNRGAFGGTPLVAGSSQTGSSLNIDGCSNSITNWIRKGDWFSVNNELKICTTDANSDGGGLVTLSFTPRLHRPPTDNAAITTIQGTGRFMLENSHISWTNKLGGFSDLSLSFVEDITA